MSEQTTMHESAIAPPAVDNIEVISAVWRRKGIIALVVLTATLMGAGISLLMAESFLSTAIILPETDKSKLGSLGGLSDLASLAGVNIGGGEGSLVKLYPTILRSEAILRPVIFKEYQTNAFPHPVNLIAYWKIDERTPERAYEAALKRLSDELQVTIETKTSVITLAVSMPEPQLAADVLNAMTAELDHIIRKKRTTSAGEQRKFVEARLKEVKEDLTTAENALREFREKNRQVFSPQLLLEQERYIRDVQINAAVYTELRKQFEIVKIEEVKNIPVINVLDPARPAAYKIKPRRTVIVVVVFMLSLVGSIGYIMVQRVYRTPIAQALAALQRATGH